MALTAHDPVCHPAHYTVYPVQPIQITRHLGFCLGNATKYVLRAPYKGAAEDCGKALWYLSKLECEPQPPLLHFAYRSCRKAVSDLIEFLDGTPGDMLWLDIAKWQSKFLWELRNYIFAPSVYEQFPLRCMIAYVRELSRVLSLRDTTGQIYEGMTGRPQKQEEVAP